MSRLIESQKQSDLTIADFCDLHGVSTGIPQEKLTVSQC
jgi:hypothetical protein